MIVSALKLKNYRNYSELEIKPTPGLNVLFGENGQGKTNIVEAIYMCTSARSHRTSKDLELIKHDKSRYQIDLNYYSSKLSEIDYSFEKSLRLQYGDFANNKNQRVLHKNEVKLDKVSEFVGNFHAVIFAPEDLQLVKDGPTVRRRFMDLLLSQIKLNYFVSLQNYSRVLNQKNKLLKSFREANNYKLNEFDSALLDTWDEELSKYALVIINERFRLLESLKDYAREIHMHISDDAEHLTFKYKTNTGMKVEFSDDENFANIMQRLKDRRIRDIAVGSTSVGTHRDDFEIFLNDEPIRNYGSQGQQRTAVLSLKMAELQIIADITKEVPVLLLDDVMSELDANRREKLLSSLENTQIFITTTDPEQLDEDWIEKSKNSGISYFKVDAGTVTEVSV